MDLQSLSGLAGRGDSTLSQAGSSKTTLSADSLSKISPALAKARERVVAQEQSTATSLSVLGKYKSALASLVGTAGGLGKLGSGSTPAAVQSALEAFAADYNSAISGAREAFAQGGSNLGSSTLLGDLRRALNQRTAPPTLHALGIRAQADGTVKLDAAALKTALAANGKGVTGALSQFGAAVGKLAEGGLSSSSRLSSALSSLGNRLTALKKQEDALLSAATKLSNSRTTSAKTSTDRTILKAQQLLQQAYQGTQGS